MVAGIQGSRMNDQRASLPQFPGLNSQAVINQYLRQRNVQDVPDDNFFEMLMRCQVSGEVSKNICIAGQGKSHVTSPAPKTRKMHYRFHNFRKFCVKNKKNALKISQFPQVLCRKQEK